MLLLIALGEKLLKKMIGILVKLVLKFMLKFWQGVLM